MKRFLAKLSRRRAIGLYVGESTVTVSQVAATLIGPVELATQSEPYEPDQLGAVVQRLLGAVLGPKQKYPVALGVPTQRVFFSTRPIRTTKTDPSPEVLLHEVLQSPTHSVEEMAIALIKAQAGKNQVASIASCRKQYLAGLLAALAACGVRPTLTEPAPCALLRVAQRGPQPRRARTVLHVIFGEKKGLALVAAGQLPLLWRVFERSAGAEHETVRYSARSLLALLQHCGVGQTLDAIVVHGEGLPRELLESDEFQADIGQRILCSEDLTLRDDRIAYGLALGALNPHADSFDLGHTLKPRPTLRDIFPWGEVLLQAALLLCMGLYLYYRAQCLGEEVTAVQDQNARLTWARSLSEPALQQEQQQLEKRVEAVHKFLGGRILWSVYSHDIATRLPAGVTLNSLQGLCEMEAGGTKKEAVKPRKSFILRATAPVPPGSSPPREIDTFLTAIRDYPALKRDFPLIEVTDIKTLAEQGRSGVGFVVLCLPLKPVGKPAGKAGDDGKEKK